jgi:quercetin dioxygenase-like cupin family protein
MQKPFVTDYETPWQDLGSGQRRKILAFDENLMLTKVMFEKGAIGALHQHIHSQIGYIESGVFELEIDGQKKVLNAGDVFYAFPNIIHGAVCIEAGVIIDAFSPKRADFL